MIRLIRHAASAPGRAFLPTFVVSAVVGAFLFGPSPAEAGKAVSQTFGGPGSGGGQFQWPGGVAVNQATGDVYVIDVPADPADGGGGGNRLEQFAADGGFIRAWGWGVATGANSFETCTASCQPGIAGGGDGQFSLTFNDSVSEPQIAIDQTDGSVYVADTGNDRVQKFSASGAFLGKFGTTGLGDGELIAPQGVAVDPSSGDVFVGDTTSLDGSVVSDRVQRFSDTGAFEAQIGSGSGSGDGQFSRPARLSVDSTGRLYVLDQGNARVERFDAAGAFDQVFGAAAVGGPTGVMVDPATDRVFIPGMDLASFDEGIVELAPDGTVVDIHARNSGILLNYLGDVAIHSASGRIYASHQLGRQIVILDDVVPPTLSIAPVSDVGSDGATFDGTVNPQGPPAVAYRFEYSRDGITWTAVPVPDAPVGEGTSDVAVSQSVSGLAPNTDYQVRLIATRAFNAASATSGTVSFHTDPAPPLVRAVGVGSRTTTAAWLAGDVNPQSSATTYHVEYTEATNVGFANSVTSSEAPVGDGEEFVRVTTLADGLKPGTEYRYRFVATNVAGTTEGPARTFTTRNALPPAPQGRGYEMVSPLDKNGAEIARDVSVGPYTTSGTAASGNAVAYAAIGQFGGIGSGPPQSQYLSVRSDTDGWSTRGISPPIEQVPGGELSTPYTWFLSDDLSRAVVNTNAPSLPDASLLSGSYGLYLQDNTSTSSSSYQLLSRPASPLELDDDTTLKYERFIFAAATSDMRHVVFDAQRKLTSDGPDNDNNAVYEWVDGQIRFVSKLPSGDPAPGALAGFRTAYGLSSDHPGQNVISEDGKRIFFQAASALYVRENGAVTRLIASSERTGDDPSRPRAAQFWGAEAATGSKALFTSPERLTDDSGAEILHEDLYLWDGDAPAGERLTNLSAQDPSGGAVLGVAGMTDDLSRVYFVARGQLADGATEGQPSLYVWTPSAGVKHVAVLDEQDGGIWTNKREEPFAHFREARLSTDGGRLLFASRANVTATDTGGRMQIYLYDAERERLDCVSCGDGDVTGDAWMFYPPNGQGRAPYLLPRNLSADGERAFFETREALVSKDVNGKADVYMWSDGELSLISAGTGASNSEFMGASASGDDVFFTTRQQLVGADTDEQIDVYDARVGGGFPEEPPPQPCVTDECQGPPSGRPVLGSPGSQTPGGNLQPGPRPQFRVAALSRSARRLLAQGRAAAVTVRVNNAGRVATTGVARIGGRSQKVWAVAKRARRAGKVKLSVRLSKPARRQLARTGRLRVTMNVRFSGVSQPEVQRLVLVRAANKGGAR